MSQSNQPRGEGLRNAVRWLSENRDYSLKAIARAAAKYDLSPIDTEFLIRTFSNADDPDE